MEFYTFSSNIRFDDSRYAYAEKIEPINRGPADVCPTCGRPTSLLKWLHPRNIKLSRASYGDFVYGGMEFFIVSDRFVQKYKESSLSGTLAFEPIEKVKVSKNRKKLPPPLYYNVIVGRGSAIVDEENSQIKRMGLKTVILCEDCYTIDPPWEEIRGFQLKGDTWDGKDIFTCKGLNEICFTERFVSFCRDNNFTNFKCITTQHYKIPDFSPLKDAES